MLLVSNFLVIKKKSLPDPRSKRFCLIFSSSYFLALGQISRSTNDFELVFAQMVRNFCTEAIIKKNILF